ncbi:MAG: hypothetical protein DRP29_03055, partial [Thermodesulfobacteriota bacterium]
YATNYSFAYDWDDLVDVSSWGDGIKQVWVWGDDNAGNSGENMLNFTIDTIAPKPMFFNRTPTNATISGSSYVVIDSYVEDVNFNRSLLEWNYGNGTIINLTMSCKIESGSNYTCTKNVTSLEEHPNWYRVYSDDKAGNIDISEDRVVYIETKVPSITGLTTDVDGNPDYREYQFWNATATSGYEVSWVLFETNVTGTDTNYTLIVDSNVSSYDANFEIYPDNYSVGVIYYGKFWANNSIGWGVSSNFTKEVRELELNITYANGSYYTTNDSFPNIQFNFSGISISNYSGVYLTNDTDSSTPTLKLKNIGDVYEQIYIYLDQTLPSCQEILVNTVYNQNTAYSLNTSSYNIVNMSVSGESSIWIWTNLTNCYPYYDEVNLVIEIWEK